MAWTAWHIRVHVCCPHAFMQCHHTPWSPVLPWSASQFMHEHVRMRDARLYVRDLLIAYAAMQRFKPSVLPGASAVPPPLPPRGLLLEPFWTECATVPAAGGLAGHLHAPASVAASTCPMISGHWLRCPPVCAFCWVQAVQYTGAKLLQECQIPIKAEAFYIAARVRSPGAAGQATQLALLATPVPCARLQSLWSQQQLGSTAYDTIWPLLSPLCSTRGCQSGSKDLEQPPRPAQHRATNHERRAWGYTAALRSSQPCVINQYTAQKC